MLTGWPWREAGLRVSCACMRLRRQYIYGAPRPVHGHRYQQSPQGFHISQARSVPEISRAASPVFNYYLLRAGKWITIKTARSRHSMPCVFVSSETTHCPAQQIESMLGNALSQRQTSRTTAYRSNYLPRLPVYTATSAPLLHKEAPGMRAVSVPSHTRGRDSCPDNCFALIHEESLEPEKCGKQAGVRQDRSRDDMGACHQHDPGWCSPF